jgi:hypothetical protein
LIIVFVIGGVVGVFTTRARLLSDIDERLRDDLLAAGVLYRTIPNEIEDFASARESGIAVVLVSPDGATLFERAPSGADGLGTPELSAEQIRARSGEVFTVPGLEVDHGFRVAVGDLDGDGFIAIAEPLKDLRQTVRGLSQVLLTTLPTTRSSTLPTQSSTAISAGGLTHNSPTPTCGDWWVQSTECWTRTKTHSWPDRRPKSG